MMLSLQRKGVGVTLTWLFIGVTAAYALFLTGSYFLAVDGGYTTWSEYSSCSTTCGDGVKTKTRSCTNPLPQFGGYNCSRLGPAVENIPCNDRPCPVDGKYGPWGEYGPCSVTCGGGTQSHERKCDTPAPQHGGKDCSGEGPARETKSCSENPCPVNGGYSEWSMWTRCSTTCGPGQKKRTRTCTSPLTQHGGKNCVQQDLGGPVETVDCELQSCNATTTTSPP